MANETADNAGRAQKPCWTERRHQGARSTAECENRPGKMKHLARFSSRYLRRQDVPGIWTDTRPGFSAQAQFTLSHSASPAVSPSLARFPRWMAEERGPQSHRLPSRTFPELQRSLLLFLLPGASGVEGPGRPAFKRESSPGQRGSGFEYCPAH